MVLYRVFFAKNSKPALRSECNVLNVLFFRFNFPPDCEEDGSETCDLQEKDLVSDATSMQ